MRHRSARGGPATRAQARRRGRTTARITRSRIYPIVIQLTLRQNAYKAMERHRSV